MGSRIMHLIISDRVATRLEMSEADRPRFLLGGVAPDGHKAMNQPKSRSHFIEQDTNGVGLIRLDRFLDRYAARFDEPFVRGYYVHLLADTLWGHRVYGPRTKGWSKEERQAFVQRAYEDFTTLNGLLINAYAIHHLLPVLEMADTTNSIDEISGDALIQMKNDVRFDFHENVGDRRTRLSELALKDMKSYIDDSITSCLVELEKAIER